MGRIITNDASSHGRMNAELLAESRCDSSASSIKTERFNTKTGRFSSPLGLLIQSRSCTPSHRVKSINEYKASLATSPLITCKPSVMVGDSISLYSTAMPENHSLFRRKLSIC